MKFEEQFPNLKFSMADYALIDGILTTRKEVKKNCLDKKKVLEVLNGELLIEVKVQETKKKYGIRLINVIKKELGLNNKIFGMDIKVDKNLKKRGFRLK